MHLTMHEFLAAMITLGAGLALFVGYNIAAIVYERRLDETWRQGIIDLYHRHPAAELVWMRLEDDDQDDDDDRGDDDGAAGVPAVRAADMAGPDEGPGLVGRAADDSAVASAVRDAGRLHDPAAYAEAWRPDRRMLAQLTPTMRARYLEAESGDGAISGVVVPAEPANNFISEPEPDRGIFALVEDDAEAFRLIRFDLAALRAAISRPLELPPWPALAIGAAA